MDQETLLFLANVYASRGLFHISDLFCIAAEADVIGNQRIVHGLVKIALAELSRNPTIIQPSELVGELA
jgi:hypothetical protein